jgi:hypothetical protein
MRAHLQRIVCSTAKGTKVTLLRLILLRRKLIAPNFPRLPSLRSYSAASWRRALLVYCGWTPYSHHLGRICKVPETASVLCARSGLCVRTETTCVGEAACYRALSAWMCGRTILRTSAYAAMFSVLRRTAVYAIHCHGAVTARDLYLPYTCYEIANGRSRIQVSPRPREPGIVGCHARLSI